MVHRIALQRLGFLVTESRDWPDGDRTALDYHVVIVAIQDVQTAPMMAARLRAKPRFGQRVLIGLVRASTSAADRLTACASGFDDVLDAGTDSRQLIARVLKRLRARPEYHCMLPPADKRRSAA